MLPDKDIIYLSIFVSIHIYLSIIDVGRHKRSAEYMLPDDPLSQDTIQIPDEDQNLEEEDSNEGR